MGTENFPYLHGYNEEEQLRLQKQAEFHEQIIYRDIDFSDAHHILEVGCGVGAQTQILLRRFPRLKISGIDFSEKQLEAAKRNLAKNPAFTARTDVQKMDAQSMTFKGRPFDGAFLCWVLEHVPDPARVLSEVRRVLKPGSRVYATEVLNATFFLDPYSPNVWKYWMAFNDFQYDSAGDPFVGAKLGNLLTSVGFRKVHTKVKTLHYDNRQPEKRRDIIEYWLELLMSARDQLIEAKYTTPEIADAAEKEMRAVQSDPNAVFFYSFIQASAEVGE